MFLFEQLNERLDQKHLLKHAFYQAWSAGELTKQDLAEYAGQYFHHVDAFPRYISATHSNCADINARQVLLENLIDEEKGSEHHPELWLRFAEGIGTDRETVQNAKLNRETQELIDTFFELSHASYAEGLGALYAYERQVPEVAAKKIEGLKEFYNIADERTLQFFEVHLEADVHHSQATKDLFEQLTPAEQEKAMQAAEKISNCLWNFLSGVEAKRQARLTETAVH